MSAPSSPSPDPSGSVPAWARFGPLTADPPRLGIEQIPTLVWTTDAGLRIASVGDSAVPRPDVRPGDLVGQTLSDVLGTDDPDHPTIAAHRRALGGEEAAYDGGWPGDGYRSSVGPMRGPDGAIAGTVGVALRADQPGTGGRFGRSEERFRTVFDRAPVGIALIDHDGRIIETNRSLQELLGYGAAELRGLTIGDVVHPADAAPNPVPWDDVWAGTLPRFATELRYVRKDGSVIAGCLTVAAATSPDGTPWGTIGIVEDITERRRAEEALRDGERNHRALLAAAVRQAQEGALLDRVRTALAAELDLPALIRTVVGATADAFGYSLVSIYLRDGDALVLQHQVGYDRVLERIPVARGIAGRVARTGDPVLLEDASTDPDFLAAFPGVVSEVCVPLRDAGRVVGVLNVESAGGPPLTEADLRLVLALSEHVDVALGRARLHDRVRASEARFRSLVQHATDVVAVLDADGTRRYVSPAVERVLGYAPDELLGASVFALVHPEDQDGVRRLFAETAARPGASAKAELRMRHRDGSWRWLDAIGTNLLHDRDVRGIVVNSRDVTERKAFEERLTRQAHYDPVTDLPNRALFGDRLDRALDRARVSGGVGLLFLDLDGFKVVNDSLGHEAGDRALALVGERLATCLRAGDTVARFGGDEFIVLLEGGDVGEAERVADRMLTVLRPPVRLNGHELHLGASVGIAVSGAGLDRPSDLLRAADTALYRAKAAGGGIWAAFEPAMHAEALARLETEAALQGAVEREELALVYQPEVDLATGRVVAVEALMRWHRPGHGVLLPGAFLPLAEETGLILRLGRWALAEACRAARAWPGRDGPAPVVSVNLSARECRQDDLVALVAGTLRDVELPPGRLRLEVTEQALIEDLRAAGEALRGLRDLGVGLAIDDFGTGYSSLGYLRRLPVDALKLDRSFVAGLADEAADRAVVEAVTALAHALGMGVTAEGVETPAQLARVRAAGCDRAQGFHISVPLPPQAVAAFVWS